MDDDDPLTLPVGDIITIHGILFPYIELLSESLIIKKLTPSFQSFVQKIHDEENTHRLFRVLEYLTNCEEKKITRERDKFVFRLGVITISNLFYFYSENGIDSDKEIDWNTITKFCYDNTRIKLSKNTLKNNKSKPSKEFKELNVDIVTELGLSTFNFCSWMSKQTVMDLIENLLIDPFEGLHITIDIIYDALDEIEIQKLLEREYYE